MLSATDVRFVEAVEDHGKGKILREAWKLWPLRPRYPRLSNCWVQLAATWSSAMEGCLATLVASRVTGLQVPHSLSKEDLKLQLFQGEVPA